VQAACAKSKNRHLGAIVSIALNTGMRKAETMGLVWERVDLASDYGLSARLVFYKTKSGKPRGIPLNQDATAALSPRSNRNPRSVSVRCSSIGSALSGARSERRGVSLDQGRDRGRALPRPASLVRQPLHDARWQPLRPEGDSRALGYQNDRQVLTPIAEPSARGRGPPEGPCAGAGRGTSDGT
jgi:Phage integrase family